MLQQLTYFVGWWLFFGWKIPRALRSRNENKEELGSWARILQRPLLFVRHAKLYTYIAPNDLCCLLFNSHFEPLHFSKNSLWLRVSGAFDNGVIDPHTFCRLFIRTHF
jgi:hypothetical protein